MTTAESINEFLLNELSEEFTGEKIDPAYNLIEMGIVDSLGIMKLKDFLESTFNIKVLDEEILPDNFQTIDSIVDYVNRKSSN